MPNFSGSYRQALLNKICSDQLPVHYGGSAMSEDGCPKCGVSKFMIKVFVYLLACLFNNKRK